MYDVRSLGILAKRVYPVAPCGIAGQGILYLQLQIEFSGFHLPLRIYGTRVIAVNYV